MNPQTKDPNQAIITPMNQQEVKLAVEWARQEGWNPGIHDATCFYQTDPAGFYAAKVNGEIVGTVSAVNYGGGFVFAGFYIVRTDMRMLGVGAKLYSFLMDKFQDCNVGIDGVLEMQATYERHGFLFSHKNSRYMGTAKGELSNLCISISQENFEEIVAYDAKCFSVPRPEFLKHWLTQEDSHAFMTKSGGEVCGYGVIRKCFEGHKIGPLFANTKETASALLESLMSTVQGEMVFLDVPEPNSAGVLLAKKYGMQSVFATVRMYTKRAVALPLDQIYGVTSFELG
ncbi:MAG: GNAT family N-acetyltransferase [Candidatus Bathyarchaeota archaeon]|nr:GNAT family N-acetyltransferase [Candidatus Bathyarchaeota archaeon]